MNLDFEKGGGLLPVIVQDDRTDKVLMLGYMNKEALDKTKETHRVTFYSRSKGRLWTKGETSGNYLNLESILPDCDGDTLLIKARPDGPACHTGADTCFNESNENSIAFLKQLTAIIEDRKTNPNNTSYVSSLMQKGVNKVAQKVGEEAVEVVIEAKDSNPELFLNESADLLFHLMILLTHKGYQIEDVLEILKARHNSSH